MIPPTLTAFRALMERAAQSAYYTSQDVLAEEGERMRDKLDADALRALAVATPEQLCGIVREHVDDLVGDSWSAGYVAAMDDTPMQDP